MIVFVDSTTNEIGEQGNDAFSSTVRVYLDELESLRLMFLIFSPFKSKIFTCGKTCVRSFDICA